MPKKSSDASEEQFERHFRHSLQPRSPKGIPDTNFRHTQSHRYESTGKKKEKKSVILTPIPDTVEISIPEEEVPPKKSKSKTDLVGSDLERKASRSSKTSKSSRKSEATGSIYAFQNHAFDDKFDKRSISSTRAGSSRTSSVQSLE